jgi:hypothetical protein
VKHLSDYTRALCLAGIATAATAGTGTGALQFIAPTTYVDGSALPLSDIAQYDVDCGFKAKGASYIQRRASTCRRRSCQPPELRAR